MLRGWLKLQFRSYSFKFSAKTVFSKIEGNSEKSQMYLEQLTNSFYTKKKQIFRLIFWIFFQFVNNF